MKKISLLKQMFFAKRMAFLIGSGMPIVEALEILSDQSKDVQEKTFFKQVADRVKQGNFLSTALESLSGSFSDFAINIIRVGEEGASLGESLAYLSEEIKKRVALKKKIISALFYPALIVFITLCIIFAMVIFVFPKILPIFTAMKASLPITTRMLILFSTVTTNYFWLIILILCVISVFFIFVIKTEIVKYRLGKAVLVVPVIGKLFTFYYLANFSRTMGLLLKNTSNIDSGLFIASNTCANLAYRQEFKKMSLAVRGGGKISTYAINNTYFFPKTFGNMVAVGESAGSLSETFLYMANNYEQEVEDLSKNLSSLIEPFLMVFMGLLVAFVAMSIILPIYSITDKLRS